MAMIRSERPSCVWVSPSDINGRIDATYFHCDYLPLDSFLAHFPKHEVVELDRFLSKPRRVLYQKTTSFASGEAPESAVPFISGVDIDGPTMTINWQSVRYVEQWMLEKYPKGRLIDGSLLIKVKGPHQHTAFVTRADRTALVSGTVFFAGVRGINPYYLAAYLSSRSGTAWRTRLRTNTTVEFIGNEELRAVPVLLPDRGIQDYIGAKVELAERCRAEGAKEHSDACTRLDAIWSWETIAGRLGSTATARAHLVDCNLFDDRLDPEFYQQKYLVLAEWLNGKACWELRELVGPPIKGVQPSYDVNGRIPALTVTHVDPFVLEREGATGFVTEAWLIANPRARIEAGELLYTVTGPPLGETVVVEELHLPAAVNSHVARVSPKGSFRFPHLLAGMLNSPLGQLLTTRYCKGIRQKELYPEDFLRFRFPKMEDSQVRLLDQKFRAACRLAQRSRSLVGEAKTDVEALIDGTLDTKAILSGKLKPPTEEEVLGA